MPHRQPTCAVEHAPTAPLTERPGARVLLALATLLPGWSSAALADPVDINIASQPLPAALREFARQTGIQVAVQSDLTGGKTLSSLDGKYEPVDGLAALLKDTGLTAYAVNQNTYGIRELRSSTLDSDSLHTATYSSSNVPVRLAQAQTDPADSLKDTQKDRSSATADDQRAQLDEVLVTARKVTERLQDVPSSIVALGATQLEEANIVTLADIGRVVAGVNIVSAGPGKNQLIIRGLSSGGSLSMVGFYIDDTPIARGADPQAMSVSDPAIFDLARVEVLRGPQGTLYGASAMGGTIKYVTQQPDLRKFTGWTKLSTSFTNLAGGPNTDVETVVNVPVVEDFAAVRASVFYRHNDGYLDRYHPAPTDILAVLPGAAGKDVNTESTYGGRIAVALQPTEYLTITPSASIQRMKLGGDFSFDYPIGTFDNPIQSRALSEPAVDEQQMYALNVHANLGKVSITSSTSYFNRSSEKVEDESKETFFFAQPAQTSVYPVPFYLHYPNHNFTEELRMAFAIGRVDGVVGGFYQRVAGKSHYDWVVPNGYYAAYGDIFGGATSFYQGGHDLTDTQKALFGEFNIALTSKLKATLGGREFVQDQHQLILASGALQGDPASNDGSSHASGFTPKYGLSYNATADLMAYAIASKGFREGGTFVPIPNDPCAADLAALGLNRAPTQFKPDSLWNYELGAKTQWLNRRLTVNPDIYYIKWKDVQQSIGLPQCGFGFTGNFGTATSKGAELEIQYEPLAALRFGLLAAFNEAQLTSTVIGTGGVAGQSLQYAPKWTGSASVEYGRSISADAVLTGRLDFNTTSVAYRSFNTAVLNYVQPGYSLMNARLEATIRERWRVSLFATNVLDKRAAAAPDGTYSLNIPTTYREVLQRPRTVGVEARFNF